MHYNNFPGPLLIYLSSLCASFLGSVKSNKLKLVSADIKHFNYLSFPSKFVESEINKIESFLITPLLRFGKF